MLPFRTPTASDIAAELPLKEIADLVTERIMDRVSVHLDEIADLIAANSGDVIAESLVEHIDYEDLPINYDEFIIDYEELAKEVDHSDIACELAYSHIGAQEVAAELAESIDELW